MERRLPDDKSSTMSLKNGFRKFTRYLSSDGPAKLIGVLIVYSNDESIWTTAKNVFGTPLRLISLAWFIGAPTRGMIN